jgi:hypothetical protein
MCLSKVWSKINPGRKESIIMKRNLFFLLPVLMTILLSFSGNPSTPISYIESSSGLQTMNLDGGRTEIEMADINSDGHIDFLSIGDHGSPYVNTQEHGIMVWFGNGTGANWVLFQNGNFGYGGIAIGDVNNDGKLDAAYAMHHNYSSNDFGNQLIEAALGDGTGNNWAPWDDSLATQGESWGMFSTDLGDFDNDGKLDIGSVSFGCCAGVHMYKNLGNGAWRQTFGFTGGNCEMDMVFGDMNNDGNLDAAVAHSYGTPYFGDGNGNFTLQQTGLPPGGNLGYRGVSLGDVDNDGAKELAFIQTASPNNGKLNVWKWSYGTQSWQDLSGSLPTSPSYSATALYDMNMDGYADLVVFGAGQVTIWAGNGGTNWTQLVSFTGFTSPGGYSDMTVGDADHNGYADIVIEASQSCGTFCTRNIIKFFKETTPFTMLSITPMFPRGYERFKNNSVRFVEWVSSAPQNQTTKVKLEFSWSGTGGPWTLMADSLPNNGRYQWTVPSEVNSANCFIRHTVYIPGGASATGITPNPFIVGNPLGISSNNEQPAEYRLYQNYPNPFNAKSKIKYQIGNTGSKNQKVELTVYNVLGEKIGLLVSQEQGAGTYEVEWDAVNFPSGVYFYKLTSRDFSETRAMILLK